MMMLLGFQLFDGPGGEMLADFGRAEALEISDGEHGFESLTAFVPMTEDEAFRWYAAPGVPWAVLSAGPIAWEGRVEDMAVVDGGLEIGAFGGWRALSDLPYTALWSRTTTAGWRVVTNNDISTHTPERYEMDNNNRLYISPRAGETFVNQDNVGGVSYAAPHNGGRNIVTFSCDYEFLCPTNWQFRVIRINEDFSSGTSVNTVTATGSLQTGSLSLTFTGQARLLINIRNNTGSDSTISGSTGDNYLKLTNIRIKTTTASTVTADAIAADLVSATNGLNADQLRNITALIQSPGVDMRDELYEEEWPQDILTRLAKRGDSTGRQYEAGVWENRTLHFRPRYSNSRTWLVDARNLTASRTMDTLRNQMYAVYRDANNRLKRTAVQTDGSPLASAGDTDYTVPPFSRRGYIDVETTSQTQAETERDIAITDRSVITPRAQFDVTELYDEAGGGPYPLWLARAGDLVIIRNLSPGLGTAVDRLRQFRIKRKRYDVIADRLQLTPELELPDLAVMVAATDSVGLGSNTRPYGFTAREG